MDLVESSALETTHHPPNAVVYLVSSQKSLSVRADNLAGLASGFLTRYESLMDGAPQSCTGPTITHPRSPRRISLTRSLSLSHPC